MVLFVSTMFLLTGCNPGTPPGPSPTALHVTRPALPAYHFDPLDVTIRDTAAVERLYQAAYALPTPPSGTVNCPNDIGLVYHLNFLQNTISSVQQMNLNATGCQYLLIGQDSNDVRRTNQSFLDLFTKTVGIPSLVPPIPGRT